MPDGDQTSHTPQIAALPMRWDAKGNLLVLMVTSRRTKRWVMPKGRQMDGEKPWRAAEIEALEEAGALGHVGTDPVGAYVYDKVLEDGTTLPCEVTVFPMLVAKLKRNWKERRERKRRWFTAKEAARRVDEPDLSDMLRRIATKPHKRPPIRRLLKAV